MVFCFATILLGPPPKMLRFAIVTAKLVKIIILHLLGYKNAVALPLQKFGKND